MSKTSNHAVGECYRTNANQDPRKRNIHDPEGKYRWADSSELARKNLLWNSITWAGRALFGVIFLASIGLLIFTGLLL